VNLGSGDAPWLADSWHQRRGELRMHGGVEGAEHGVPAGRDVGCYSHGRAAGRMNGSARRRRVGGVTATGDVNF
jgi:hypothetical protein